ncbi:MAG: hypothetical protein OEO77_05280 [Acidimicrobiia bacterium]|nr:hypothetical protein [Acidimicrobiia bacterium]
MSNRSVLADAFEHHVWATLRLIGICQSLSSDHLGSEVPGTFGSIIETFRHLVGADVSYHSAISGGNVARFDASEMGLAALASVMERNGPAWAAVLDEDLDPEQMVIRIRDDGSESHAPLGVRLAQALHHGTDHRSQICTALTNRGITPPAIDVWDYAEHDGRLQDLPPPS